MAGPKGGAIFLCLCGTTGSGKSTLANELLKEAQGSMTLSISATSRAPRAGEQDGVHYHFITRDDFEKKIKRQELFEWEETHGNYYGTLRTTIDQALADSHDLLFDVDIRGALRLKQEFPGNTVIVFIAAPSFDVLSDRLKKRGAMPREELKKRFDTARREYDQLFEAHTRDQGEIDYFVVNAEKDRTFHLLRSIVSIEKVRFGRLPLDQIRTICQIGEVS